ncbi:hypothetical protein J056_004004 [Wallemia ichthyophaga EXF-994]|uniref:ATPase AAA-type core domain-containing protein n=1 Tax=Wallemia ichthyophaga (strain EXF-994 / CBS 113033) TaxID=1299270 RepID=R9AHW9_WALI9|nr:uncharacterized protein J056_004004 [Wallemia ichthyophaga EXF-994]EOR01768.1 hypothetical protein J056_004004 [Wallemia ichthyophaga EXF-994]
MSKKAQRYAIKARQRIQRRARETDQKELERAYNDWEFHKNLLENKSIERTIGQARIDTSANAVQMSPAGLQSDNRSVASSLFLGPKSTCKTELSRKLSGALLNDQKQALININMSEYQEKHTVSPLVGATPRYVGYEESGQLSEVMRRRPYSVVLLD